MPIWVVVPLLRALVATPVAVGILAVKAAELIPRLLLARFWSAVKRPEGEVGGVR